VTGFPTKVVRVLGVACVLRLYSCGAPPRRSPLGDSLWAAVPWDPECQRSAHFVLFQLVVH